MRTTECCRRAARCRLRNPRNAVWMTVAQAQRCSSPCSCCCWCCCRWRIRLNVDCKQGRSRSLSRITQKWIKTFNDWGSLLKYLKSATASRQQHCFAASHLASTPVVVPRYQLSFTNVGPSPRSMLNDVKLTARDITRLVYTVHRTLGAFLSTMRYTSWFFTYLLRVRYTTGRIPETGWRHLYTERLRNEYITDCS